METTLVGLPPQIIRPSNGLEVRLILHLEVEATAAQAAGVNGGRLTDVEHLSLLSPGVSGQELVSLGDATYFDVWASLIGAGGPFTNISTTPLAAPAAKNTTLEFWVRTRIKRWSTAANPVSDQRIALRAPESSAGWMA